MLCQEGFKDWSPHTKMLVDVAAKRTKDGKPVLENDMKATPLILGLSILEILLKLFSYLDYLRLPKLVMFLRS